ncbi:MAG: discoidin domain-containing protein [Verrucomicrobiota bacterium]
MTIRKFPRMDFVVAQVGPPRWGGRGRRSAPSLPTHRGRALAVCRLALALVCASGVSAGAAQVTASSSQSGELAAANAFDGNRGTRWSSDFSDPQWLVVDLGQTQDLVGLFLFWETAYAYAYDIQLSADGTNWTTAFTTDKGDGGMDDINFRKTPARFIKVNGRHRATAWGYSLFEVVLKTAREPWGEGEIPDVFLRRAWRFQTDPKEDESASFRDPAFDDSAWPLLRSHASWQEQGYPDYRGCAWYRSSFYVPAAWTNADPFLLLTDIRDEFELFVNGKGMVGSRGARAQQRIPLKNELRYDAENVVSLDVDGQGPDSGILGSILLAASDQALASGLRELKQRDARAAYDFLAHLEPEGYYPYWLSNRQGYWTVVGVDEDFKESLFCEDGTLEPYKSFSIAPFLFLNERLVTREDVALSQSLEQGYLPIPRVSWEHPQVRLTIEALGAGAPGKSVSYVGYQVENSTTQSVTGRLYLALRPFEINPPWQWGGLNRIHDVEWTNDAIRANEHRIVPLSPPTRVGVCSTSSVDVTLDLQKGMLSDQASAHDPAGFASAAIQYDFSLEPGARTNFSIAVPLYPDSPVRTAAPLAADVAALWQSRLRPLPFHCPDRELLDTAQATLAYILINRDGPAIQPGSRAYEAAWIRDGAMTGSTLLKFGYTNEPREFFEWYAGRLYEDGRVPAIVILSRNETNPVKEYDSQGELVYACLQYYLFTRDKAFLERTWPAAERSLKYLEQLRRSELDETMKDSPDRRRYYGILPKSVSHEGYYPEPGNHSYWDDFWALKGWKDGLRIAAILGRTNDLPWIRREAEDLRRALYGSIEAARAFHKIDYIPGCAELGDFDPSATAIAVVTCDETRNLPRQALDRTFEKYYERFSERLKPGWNGSFTPYEFRVAHALFCLGQKQRAWAVLNYLMTCRQPAGWREWPEAVYVPPRQPGYIGDMPHTWAASGFLDAFRAAFLYEDESAGRLILAAGIPEEWLSEQETAFVRDAPTCWGRISYSLRRESNTVFASVSGPAKVPRGIFLRSPVSAPIREATVNGTPCPAVADGVQIEALPAEVVISH